MSSLTKKILFFFILSMMCNSILSGDYEECKNNVNYAFSSYNTPKGDFIMALIAYSEKLLTSNNLNNLLRYFKGYTSYINKTKHRIFVKKHDHVINYLKFVGDRFDRNSASDIDEPEMAPPSIGPSESDEPEIDEPEKEVTEDVKRDVVGYFRFLIRRFNKYHKLIEGYVMYPAIFCQQVYYTNIPICEEALKIMFNLNDDPRQAEIYRKLRGVHSLRHVYLNYTYVDFTPQNIFRLPNVESIEQNEEKNNTLLTSIMANYFIHVLDATADMLTKKRGDDGQSETGSELFPSIEEYCKLPVENRI